MPDPGPGSKGRGLSTPEEGFHRELPEWAAERLRTWHRQYMIGLFLNHILGVLAIFFTVASFFFATDDPRAFWSRFFGAWSVVAVAALAIMAPLRNARGYIAAWRVLDDVAIGFQSDESVTEKDLREAIKKGEQILSNRDPY